MLAIQEENPNINIHAIFMASMCFNKWMLKLVGGLLFQVI